MRKKRVCIWWPVGGLLLVISACISPFAGIETPTLELDIDLPAARLNNAYSATPTVTGGLTPYTFKVVGLPAGMTFSTTTGTISGTPLNASTGMSVAVTVIDGDNPPQTATKQATLVIKVAPISITTTELPAGTVNQSYSTQLTAVNGLSPYTWAVVAGVLPNGLRLDTATGIISGTPTAAQTQDVTIAATDADNPESTDSVELTIEIGA